MKKYILINKRNNLLNVYCILYIFYILKNKKLIIIYLVWGMFNLYGERDN